MSDGPFRPRELPDPPPAALPERPAPGPPRPAGRFSSVTWIVGVAVLLLLAVVTVNTIRTEGRGGGRLEPGAKLPPFAAPLALGDLVGDANLDEDRACAIRGPRVLNVCELAERGPVVLAFVATRSEECERQVDVLDRLRPRFPGVQFAVVAIRDERERVRRVVRERGWGLPVGWDRDGAVSNAYAVAGCPTVTFARRGGRIESTSLGPIGEAEVARRIRGLR